MLRCLAVLALLASPAFADEVDPHRVAVAVNSPISWAAGGAFAISGYVGLTEHQAIRANLAAYQANYTPAAAGATFALTGGDNECPPTGTTFDVGAGWVYFPRKLYSGLSLELGALRRSTPNTDLWCEELTPFETTTHTVTYAARAMIGWSWMLGDHAFIALAVGVSSGRERGREDDRQTDESPIETYLVDHWTTSGETYLRFGAAI